MSFRPAEPTTVLVVDDDEQERTCLSNIVSSLGYAVESAADGREALAKLDTVPVSAIVTDLIMPEMDGFALLRALIDRGQLIPTIVLTSFGDIEQAVTVVHEFQAFWFLEKPAQRAALAPLLERAISYRELLRGTERLQRQLSHQGVLDEMVGSSRSMQQVFTLIQRVAPTQASVLITGESGTGKEMVARAIHRLSNRRGGPFVAINCAALPADLIESELFGHERGSFTGATGRHLGCFEQANRGTLLLDEIGEMPPNMQARLLRALEESMIRRVGGSEEIPVDVRIVAATNRDVVGAGDKTMREDLYYRLNVFHIPLPPLRERKEDIPLISKAIIDLLNHKHGCSVTHLHFDALQRLMAYSWPGNVRELRNTLEWAVITAQKDLILSHHLPASIGNGNSPPHPVSAAAPEGALTVELGRRLDDIKREYIAATLQSVNNDHKRAAQILGISVRTLYTRKAESKANAS